MPEKDDVIQSIRAHLNDAMAQVQAQHPNAGLGFWTSQVKTALCNACIQVFPGPLHIYANGVAPINEPNVIHEQREFLYDVTCLRTHPQNGEHWQNSLLIAECEWSNQQNIVFDFKKLLLTRAQVRVMIYHYHSGGGAIQMPFDILANYINQYHDAEPGDTYLLAGFKSQQIDPRIVYYRIDAHQRQAEDQCELAPIQGDWYPGLGPPQP